MSRLLKEREGLGEVLMRLFRVQDLHGLADRRALRGPRLLALLPLRIHVSTLRLHFLHEPQRRLFGSSSWSLTVFLFAKAIWHRIRVSCQKKEHRKSHQRRPLDALAPSVLRLLLRAQIELKSIEIHSNWLKQEAKRALYTSLARKIRPQSPLSLYRLHT